ncbi:cysteinyl-tRNA synthetase [Microcella putealis]|uniref:Cysteine--tRNA ligase n=1 Tax=Microcella putealis TaxID=337005 RepID=A0A4Q7LQW3_9MICO|nr:cysteine--tRNA ligase [Microcella putealis]RZS57296.1 cysteinyl-tRNA synthetase [Microcella putealis]TQM19561.1 cysteinyl-tRNA synthetase [Microcella putealis]
MSIRLYDSLQQAVVDFTPREPGRASMYVCGPTVQSAPHIGHLRSALVYDLWRRWLAARGYAVTFIRNVTDIDDKILANETDDEPWYALAYRVELDFTAAYRALGILPPTYEPRATASIDRMLALIHTLIERGHAYAAPDGSGDVYFDVRSWPSYGALTRQSPDDMEDAADAPARAKRDPRDFALWKGAKEGEPASAHWESPWGPGRPGWHIECSAMAARYLGEAFDIHGGGLDLRFPHHENELAQSRAAGHDFATHWVHNGLVAVGGQKMSKSLGNSVFAAELLGEHDPAVVRYWLGSAHYRSTIDFTPGSLDEAKAAFERVTSFVARADAALGAAADVVADAGDGAGAASLAERVPERFAAALDDDLGVPQALAVLHDTVRAGNTALDAGELDAARDHRDASRAMLAVLGLDEAGEHPQSGGAAERALDALVSARIAERRAARAERNFAESDRIRDELIAAGILLDDTATSTEWRLDG